MMIDFNKYNPLKKAVREDKPQDVVSSGAQVTTISCAHSLTSWQDSAPVMRLFEYLKQHHDRGIKLYQGADGKPSLNFIPGLGLADMKTERWKIAVNAMDLLQEASIDLYQLLKDSLIDLPMQP